MKGYYLFAPVEAEVIGEKSGVERKVRAQHKIISEHFECELVILPPVKYTGSRLEKIVRRLPFTAAWRKWEYKGEFDDADFLYIRQVYHDSSFIRYLRDINKSNPKIKIIYEIPTYPYESEGALTISNMSFTIKERMSRKRLACYVDRIVTFYNQESIFNVPCLKLINGYDFSNISPPERIKTDSVELISVSTTAFWHGYDRMIEGIHNYYSNGGKENIVYHLVGDILPEHQALVENYALQDNVILHGRMSGEPLEKLYKKCFVGIDILGGHRKDYPVSSTLKSREYAAWGLPMITSSPVDYMPKDYEYQLIVPYDDTPVDIERVTEFYHNIYDNVNCNDVAKQIRTFAQELCDMSVTMMPVVDYLGD